MKKLLIALSLCASTALLASDADYHWEFTPVVGGTVHEGSMDLDNSFTFGLRVAKNLQDTFIDQIELGYDRGEHIGLANGAVGKKPNANVYHINAVKDILNFTDDLKLYGLIGLGYMDYTKKVANRDLDSGFGQYGAGIKYYWTDNFATKVEVRDAIRFDDGDHIMFYSLGFAADFGARNPAPVAAEPASCVDSDNDGVCDNVDKCPGTPAGVVVDEFGCEKVIRLDLGVNFAFDSAEISPKYYSELEKVSSVMKEHAEYSVRLEGNTDSIGKEAYNQKLSERRANAVSKALVKLGVPAEKITTVGLGEKNPVATNDTAEGRAQNRRVDAKFRK